MVAALAAIAFSQNLIGTFTQGDGRGIVHTFDFKDNARVEYRGSSSMPMLTGTFSIAGETLTLNIKDWSRKTALPSTFNIVPWGKTTFLIAHDEVPYFLYRIRKGWRGEFEGNGPVGFLRNDVDRKVESLPALLGTPTITDLWQAEIKRNRPIRIIHCAYDDEGPIGEGTQQGIANGTVLRQIDGAAVAWVEDVEKDYGYIRRLSGTRLRPGLKMEPSESPLVWRELIKRKLSELNNEEVPSAANSRRRAAKQ